jgi:hypothetical protein
MIKLNFTLILAETSEAVADCALYFQVDDVDILHRCARRSGPARGPVVGRALDGGARRVDER